MFKRNGWSWDVNTKGWTTPDIENARPLIKHAVGAAKEHLVVAERVREAIVAESWAEDTETIFPAPDGEHYLPFQKAGIEYAIKRKHTLIADPPGLGKSQPVDEPVLTPNGWTTMGELRVGDFVVGVDGRKTKVVGVFPQGILDTYQVKFSDGASTFCSNSHLWAVADSNRRKRTNDFTVKPLSEISDRGLKEGTRKKWTVPVMGPVEFPERKFVIPPYTLGVLLGDGSLHQSSPCVSIANFESEIKDRLEAEILPGYRLHSARKADKTNRCKQYTISRPRCGSSPSTYMTELRRLNLAVKGDKKRIPAEYLTASAEQRLELLRGLMDSDGSARQNRITFHSCNPYLAADVQQLVWSLGGIASERTYVRHDGKSDETRINVTLDTCPFHLTRKATEWSPNRRHHRVRRFIDSITKVGKSPHVCISVAAADNLYVTRDYVVTHNTIQAIGVHNATKAKRVLVVCPASLKVNWKREWEKWDVHGLSVGIAHSKTRTKTVKEIVEGVEEKWVKRWTEHVWPDTDVVMINYDMLDAFNDAVKDVSWDLLICDEAHLLKTKTALRTLCVFGGARKGARKNGIQTRKPKTYTAIEATKTLFLTGTPILSKPVELWNLIRICDRPGLGKNYDDFVFDFCGAYYEGDHLNVMGASNSDELNRLMRERFMVRRDKRSVLKELPDKTRELIMLPQDKLEKPVKKELSRMESALNVYESIIGISEEDRSFRYIKAIESLTDKLAKALEEQDSETPNWDLAVKTMEEPDQILFTEISLAREEVAIAKVGMVVEHIKKLVDSEEPVICFAYHKSVISTIKERLEKVGISVGVVTGSVASNKRQQVVDDFQSGSYDVILGNIIAMGVGFTLTRASFVVFAELDWVPALIEQAEDRAWRYGQLNAVLVQHLVVDGSIEARMAIALLDKMGVIHDTLDYRDTPYPYDDDVSDG